MDTACAQLPGFYARTEYRVRLPRGGHTVIRVGQPLPAALRRMLPTRDASWAFITAWNPHSRPRATARNRAAQRALLARLQHLDPVPHVAGGVGAGASADGRWREPGVFVAGIMTRMAQRLMREFEQEAIVIGTGIGPAALCWNR